MEYENFYQHSGKLSLSDEKRKLIKKLGYDPKLIREGIKYYCIGKEIGALNEELNPEWYKNVAQHLGIPEENVTRALKEVIGFGFDSIFLYRGRLPIKNF